MSYEIERKVITNHLQAQNFFDLSPFGLDDDGITLAPGAGFMKILPGEGRQSSMGSPGANLHDFVGLLAITILAEGGQGSSTGRAKADEIISEFTGLKLDETGGTPTSSSAVVINFARNGLAPYIASARNEGKLHRTVVHAPFLRTERM